MIPKRLTLANFMSYKQEQTINFDIDQVILFTGRNGHGKSSIFDAITWALWGKVRGENNKNINIEDIIYHGADRVKVSFLFNDSLGNTYEVIRQRHKNVTNLELLNYNGAEIIPLTEGKIIDTQGKINQILGMDYDLFINTSYLVQEQNKNFIQAPPREQAEILIKALGVTRWFDYIEKAKTKSKELTIIFNQIEELIRAKIDRKNQYLTEIVDEKELQAELDKTNQEIEELEQQLTQKKTMFNLIVQELETQRDLQQQYNEYKLNISNIERNIQQITHELQNIFPELKNKEKSINELNINDDVVQAIINNKEKILQEYNDFQTEFISFQLEGNQEINKVNLLLEKTKQEKENCIKLLEEKYRLVKQKENFLRKYTVELQNIENKINSLVLFDLKHLRDSIDEEEKQLEQLIGEEAGLSNEVNFLRNEYKKITALEDKCPTCTQPIDMKVKKQLCDQIIQEGKVKSELLKTVQVKVKEKREIINKLNETNHKAMKATEEYNYLVKYQNDLTEQIKLLNEEIKQEFLLINDLEFKITNLDQEIDKLLNKHSQFKESFNQKYKIYKEKEISIKERHQQLLQAEKYLSLKENIDLLNRQIIDKKAHLESLNTLITEKKRIMTDIVGKIDFTNKEQQKTLLEQEITLIEKKLKNNKENHKEIQERIHLNKFKKQQIELLEQEIKELQNEKEEIGVRKKGYEDLVLLCGRKGVQGLLIDNLIPMIEVEANKILRRISAGSFEFNISLQNDMLNIQVRDEYGTRKLSTFSGGELFKINLALRLGIAKIQAMKAGISIKTLIIDEGFGVLDEAGQEQVAEVINILARDFAKILIITHIKDMKNLFPTEIKVFKGPHGSIIQKTDIGSRNLDLIF